MKTPFSIWIVTGDLNRRNPPAVISNIEPNRFEQQVHWKFCGRINSQTHVPMSFYWPKKARSQFYVDRLAFHMCVYLTVCLSRDYAQMSLPIPNCMHGCFFFRDHILIRAFPFLVFNLAMCFLVIWPTN